MSTLLTLSSSRLLNKTPPRPWATWEALKTPAGARSENVRMDLLAAFPVWVVMLKMAVRDVIVKMKVVVAGDGGSNAW